MPTRQIVAPFAALGGDLLGSWSEALDADAVDGAAPDELRLRFGDLLNAERLGASPPPAYRAALLRRVREVGFSGFFSFDARTQPPLVAARHANRWDAWQHALIFGWVCERTAGAECGASYFDVLKWLPWLKLEAPLMAQPPAGTHAPADEWRLYAAQLSAVTHVVYTLGDYDQRRLDPTLLPAEFAFLQRALPAALELRMPEAVGEVADCLKAFGLAEASYAPLQAASAFLVGAQNPDGSWGWPVERRLGSIYHTTIVSAGACATAPPRRRGPRRRRRRSPLPSSSPCSGCGRAGTKPRRRPRSGRPPPPPPTPAATRRARCRRRATRRRRRRWRSECAARWRPTRRWRTRCGGRRRAPAEGRRGR